MFIGMGESWVEWESKVLNLRNIDPIFRFNQIVYVQTCGFRTYEPYGGTLGSQIKLKHRRQLIIFCVGGGRLVTRTIQT